jgi:hypothetical protein
MSDLDLFKGNSLVSSDLFKSLLQTLPITCQVAGGGRYAPHQLPWLTLP